MYEYSFRNGGVVLDSRRIAREMCELKLVGSDETTTKSRLMVVDGDHDWHI